MDLYVLAKDGAQAQFLWRFIREQLGSNGFSRVKMTSSRFMPDGLNPANMTILLCGEYWMNPALRIIEGLAFEQRGALIVKVDPLTHKPQWPEVRSSEEGHALTKPGREP
ncbi:hypothetical protein SAMN02799630_02789 [Paenibacillus sp. UNCCL117]|uniref:hypothetical protein n=1 Tax=unclassified Paenibacillus TaxID=185978 RepID=UPI00088707DD|nr:MULTISPECIES: hypothetical protein [unclassified Paenibacillus]SDD27388.1 hypothetical protein SAMN04488602_107123 [Paenibacillus sp. cl123]SFW40545.1 hypothetical protein SAMN02799630_02789 [Paenibacillus sp. UNCCL117]